MLVRRIILGVILLGVAALAYVGYKSWMARRAMMGGEVYSDSVDPVATTLKQAAATPASSSPAPVQPTPAVTTPALDHPTEAPGLTEAMSKKLPATAAASPGQPAPAGTSGGASPAEPSHAGNSSSATDTIRPNPPNGTVYAGAGHYQVYRQGNLTWRINTDTGRACVLFATEQEWRKPQVFRSGCGSNVSR